MGSCFSSSTTTTSSLPLPTAKIITLGGSLMEYSTQVMVSEVLGAECSTSFLCNSDMLYDGAYILTMDSSEYIALNDIYFVLPMAKLKYPLTALDMAALASKAFTALSSSSHKPRRRHRIQVMPVDKVERRCGDVEHQGLEIYGERSSWSSISSSTQKKKGRNSSMQARRTRVSFSSKLSTIMEAAD